MLTIILITLRECMEMLLVIFALIAYVNKINKQDLFKYIYSGSFCGLGVSAILGFLIFNQVNKFQGSTREFFLGAIMILISIFIIYYMVWMRKQKMFLGSYIDKKYKIKTTGFGFFVFSFLTTFRESIEIIVFILPQFNTSTVTIVIGIIIGSSLSVLITCLIYDRTTKLNINIVFTFITLILIFIGAGMFSEGVAVLFPFSDNIQSAAVFLYALPTIFIFLKGIIGDYIII
jgi:high-affinity iron transporter